MELFEERLRGLLSAREVALKTETLHLACYATLIEREKQLTEVQKQLTEEKAWLRRAEEEGRASPTQTEWRKNTEESEACWRRIEQCLANCQAVRDKVDSIQMDIERLQRERDVAVKEERDGLRPSHTHPLSDSPPLTPANDIAVCRRGVTMRPSTLPLTLSLTCHSLSPSVCPSVCVSACCSGVGKARVAGYAAQSVDVES